MTDQTAPSGLLRASLRANALFSACSGMVLVLVPAGLAAAFGGFDSRLLSAAGFSLIGFAGLLTLLASRREIRPSVALTVVGLDVAWVLGSGVVLLAGVLSVAGSWAVAGVADVVLVFAGLQLVGVRRLVRARAACA